MWDDDGVRELLGHRAGRGLRRVALVALMLFAALVAPIALPIRILVERVRRDTRRTEQVVRQEVWSAWRLAPGDDLPSTT
jgi:hypothetical protein